PGTQASPMTHIEAKLPWLKSAPLGCPVVPEVYKISAVSSLVTSGNSVLLPEPPIAVEHTVAQGTVLGASPVSASRLAAIGGIGMRTSIFVVRGIASVILMDVFVSRSVVFRGLSMIGEALSHTIVSRAPWALSRPSS